MIAMSEVQELAMIAMKKRIWVWSDHELADDGNVGTSARPLMSYSMAKARAETDDIIIVIPAHEELFRERYLKKYPPKG